MRSLRLFAGLGLMAAALTTALTAVYNAAIGLARSCGDFIATAIAWVAIPAPRLALDGFAAVEPMSGSPLDPALRHSMRHEANVARRSAARNE